MMTASDLCPIRLALVGLVLGVIILHPLSSLASEGHNNTGENIPVLQAVRIEHPPTLDGLLDDDCWKIVPHVSEFIFSDLRRPATEETTAWICYDAQNIYVAFYAKDSRPHLIRAQQKKRGGSVLNDDLVEVNFDVQHTHKQLYYFDVNPRGVQFETIPKGAATKTEWRGDWRAAARIVADGWTAELAIPFKLFRYRPEQTVWGVMFARYLSREREWSHCPDVGSPPDLTRMAEWRGLKLPRINRQPLLLAYGLSTIGDSCTFATGMDVKHVTRAGFASVLTLNPDFASIEQDVASIDFSYTEKILPDNRPFFAEGSGYFPSKKYLYTREIADIDAGWRSFGTSSRLSMGAMTVAEKDGDVDSALKVNYDFNPYSSISALGVFQQAEVDTSAIGGTLTLGRPSGRSGSDKLSIEASRVRWEDGSGDGNFFSATYVRIPDRGKVGYSLSYLNVDPHFDPGLGYYGEPDRIGWSADIFCDARVDDSLLRSYNWSGTVYRYLNHEGELRYGGGKLSSGLVFRNNRSISCSFTYEERPPNIDRVVSLNGTWNTQDPFRSGSASISLGKLNGAEYLFTKAEQRVSFNSRLYGALSLEHTRMRYPDQSDINTQLILSATYEMDAERSLGFRWIESKDISNIYLSFRKVATRGSDFYVIFGDPNASRTEMKLTLKIVTPLAWF